MNQLSQILQSALIKMQISQADAAQKAGIERKTFNSYVLGRTEPDLATLKKIIRVLKIETEIADWLLEHNVPSPVDTKEQSVDFLAGKLAVKDEVVAEKEARRHDHQRWAEQAIADKERSDKEKDRLLSIIENNLTKLLQVTISLTTNLADVKEDTYLGLTYQKAWVEYTAELQAQGDLSKKEELINHMHKLLAAKIPVGAKGGKKAGAHK